MLSDCIGRLEDTKEWIEFILEVETETLENVPESLQGTKRYEISENACSGMEDAMFTRRSSMIVAKY